MIKKLGMIGLLLVAIAPPSSAQSPTSPGGYLQRPDICHIVFGEEGDDPPEDPRERCPTDYGRSPPPPPPCVPDAFTNICLLDP